MRYYYLDSLRSVLMLLGVFYHAALIFSADEVWRVTSPIKSANFDMISSSLRIFRMPAFFIIAGFFTLFSLNRHAPREYLKNRAERLLIPFVCSFFFINTFQTLVTKGLLVPGPLDWAKLLDGLAIWRPSAKTISHLWFLPHLFAFALLLMGLGALARRVTLPEGWRRRLEPAWETVCDLNLAVFIMPLCAILIFILKREAKGLMAWDFHAFLDMGNITLYLPFFLFGALMFHSPRFYQSLFRIRPWHWAVFGAALLFYKYYDSGKQITIGNCLSAYSRGVLMWVGSMFCFCLFKRFLDRPSRFFTYLSDASYTIYLFHQLFVILLGALLLGAPISIYLKYPIIVGGSIGVALAIHHFLILRVGVLRLMFNGKWPKKTADGTGKNEESREEKEEASQAAQA